MSNLRKWLKGEESRRERILSDLAEERGGEGEGGGGESVPFAWQGKTYDIKRAYSGRPGCMCGCMGRYYEGADARRVVANVRRLASQGAPVEFDHGVGFFMTHGGRQYGLYLVGGA